jgi:hypothetical protein
MTVLRDLAEVEGRLLSAANERVQMGCLVGLFQLVREAETAQ